MHQPNEASETQEAYPDSDCTEESSIADTSFTQLIKSIPAQQQSFSNLQTSSPTKLQNLRSELEKLFQSNTASSNQHSSDPPQPLEPNNKAWEQKPTATSNSLGVSGDQQLEPVSVRTSSPDSLSSFSSSASLFSPEEVRSLLGKPPIGKSAQPSSSDTPVHPISCGPNLEIREPPEKSNPELQDLPSVPSRILEVSAVALPAMSATKMPRFDRCKDYDGEMPAELWLDRLDYDFEVHSETPPTAPTYLRAISILLGGEASRRFRSNPRMKSIMTNRSTAGAEEKAEVIEWLKLQYPNDDAPVEEIDVMTEVSNLQQGAAENLTSYYSRTAALLKRTGGKDLEKTKIGESSPVQKDSDRYILTSITSAFVRGVRDDKLRSHALSNNVLLIPCLWKTYEILCLSQQAIRAQEKIEADIEMRRYHERLENYVELHSGMPACVALAAQSDRSCNIQQPPNPQQSNQSAQPAQTARPAQLALPAPTQAAPARPATTTQMGAAANPAPAPNSAGPAGQYQQRYPPRYPSSSGYGSGFQRNSAQPSARGVAPMYPPLKQAKDSLNPFINGSIVYNKERDGLLCVDCGVCGHVKFQCTNAPLPFWEKAHLRSLVFPTTTVAAHHAELWTELRDEAGPNAREGNSQPFGVHRPNSAQSAASISPSTTSPSTGTSTPVSTTSGSVPFEQFVHSRKVTVDLEGDQGTKALLGAIENLQYHALSISSQEQNEAAPLVNSFMASRTRKRVRIHSSEEDHEAEPRRADTANQGTNGSSSSKNGEKKLRQLREIVGREGLGPINYRDLASRINVPLNLLELYQLSPEVSKQFRKLSTRKNQKRARKQNPASADQPDSPSTAAAASAATVGSKLVQVAPRIHPDDKAWKIPTSIRVPSKGKVTVVDLPVGMCASDQGSDIIIITPALQQKLGLQTTTLNSKGFSGVSFGTADGVMHKLDHFVTFEMGVKGIWRKVHAFVRASTGPRDTELSLLLGLPWLHAVGAKFDICKSTLTIGGNMGKEKPVTIQGPLFAPFSHLNLVLHPKAPSQRDIDNLTIKFADQESDQHTTSDSEVDSDSSGEETSSDDESETERAPKN
ncbi:hypothetical protein BKA65DRAFT_110784 [Rhexocercosporidium sp. MPI-PUGE-AT-0058]|nr:hypothetical protein BKA65DRAFT_110784 [Rhexocercosporidium sp. MPI-PUGE-AT-0058]